MKSVLILFAACGAVAVHGTALAAPPLVGDAAAGKRAFLQCQACHTVDAKAVSRAGPTLQGVYGGKIAGRPSYAQYSKALKATKGVWDEASLDQWLIRPTKFVPGTSMAFAGVSDPKRRADLIAYLKTLK